MKTKTSKSPSLPTAGSVLFLIAIMAGLAVAGPFDCFFRGSYPCYEGSYSSGTCPGGGTWFEAYSEGPLVTFCTNFGLGTGRTECQFAGGIVCEYTYTWQDCNDATGEEDYAGFPPIPTYEPTGTVCGGA